MIIYSVYILQCSDDSFYVGMTNDMERRKLEHDDGINEGAYTASRRPVKLVWVEEDKYVNNAIEREKQIKGWSRAKKLALIKGEKFELPELARKKKFLKKP